MFDEVKASPGANIPEETINMSILKSCFLLLVATLLLFSGVQAEGAKKKGDMTSYLKRTGAKYLTEVGQKPGAYTLKSGMVVEVKKFDTIHLWMWSII